MQSIQIDGIFTYVDNVKTLKLNDPIKLMRNLKNRINSDAIGAYTKNNLKIGYVPFKSNQIDINACYYVSKIILGQKPALFISRQIEKSNIITIEPEFLRDKRVNKIVPKQLIEDLEDFGKHLAKIGYKIKCLEVTFNNDYFINLNINVDNEDNVFYIVTRKYYEENVFTYDEFFEHKLISQCIYQPFLIHRLECYIYKNYKPHTKLLKKYKSQLDFKDVSQSKLSLIKSRNIDSLGKMNDELFKALFQYEFTKNEMYNPNVSGIEIDLTELKEMFPELKVGGLCYNHEMKSYCYVDFYDKDNIIEIITEDDNHDTYDMHLLKLLISEKKSIHLIDVVKNTIYTIEK